FNGTMSDCTAATALPVESAANALPGTVVNEGPMLTVNAAAVSRSKEDLLKEMICLVNPRDFFLAFITLVSFFNRFLLALMPLAFVQNRSKRKRFQFFDNHSSASHDVFLHNYFINRLNSEP
ncbi:hypothetical protein, partial [Paenibacillus mucilaginosus]|uniref:hypothetical protein n=1 Tax=Paenibacillus mucilaginosus TaxID=61624 RepID=UPI003D1AD475